MNQKKIHHILLLGGVRSGKSNAAVTIAKNIAGPGEGVVYIATGTAGDEEMKKRIEQHKKERPSGWATIEAPVHCAGALSAFIQENSPPQGSKSPEVIILDCLTMLAANILMAGGEDPEENELTEKIIRELDDLSKLCKKMEAGLIIVSNEVGMGVVPPSSMGRLYRDILGKGNKYAADQAESVLLMAAGLAVDLKALAVDLSDYGK